jgi:hypothetical protein
MRHVDLLMLAWFNEKEIIPLPLPVNESLQPRWIAGNHWLPQGPFQHYYTGTLL